MERSRRRERVEKAGPYKTRRLRMKAVRKVEKRTDTDWRKVGSKCSEQARMWNGDGRKIGEGKSSAGSNPQKESGGLVHPLETMK